MVAPNRILSLALISLLAAAAGYSLDLPRYIPDPAILALPSGDDLSDPLTYIETGLVLSGAEEENIPLYRRQVEALMREMVQSLPDQTYQRANAVLSFLHERVLRTYRERETRVDVLLSEGIFNCVSSAVVYTAFAMAAGLDVYGINTSDHAFCVVSTPTEDYDVETTNPYGFDPGNKKEFTDSFGNVTGYTYVPQGSYAQRTKLDLADLQGLILQNRISELQMRKRYRESSQLAVDRYAFLETDEAYRDMIDGFANYGAQLNDQRRYEDGITYLAAVQQYHGKSPVISNLLDIMSYNSGLTIARSGKLDAALQAVTDYVDRGLMTAQRARDLQVYIAKTRLSDALSTADFTAGVELVEQGYADGLIDETVRRDYLVSLYGREAERVALSGDHIQSSQILDAAMQKVGQDRRLAEAKRISLQNYAISVHNLFARLYNAGDYVKASQAVEEALAVVPGNQLLTKDSQIVKEKLDKR